MNLIIQSISKTHDRKSFDCGEKPLNQFLSSIARQSDERRLTRTFVLVDLSSPEKILGFYTIVPCELEAPPESELAKRYPSRPPLIRIARMAIDRRYQGRRLSELLIVDAILKAVRVSEEAGCIGCTVDAKSDFLVDYYSKYGFEPIEEGSLSLWLPISCCCALAEEMALQAEPEASDA